VIFSAFSVSYAEVVLQRGKNGQKTPPILVVKKTRAIIEKYYAGGLASGPHFSRRHPNLHGLTAAARIRLTCSSALPLFPACTAAFSKAPTNLAPTGLTARIDRDLES
jgi:hypothetical protein